jgi:hypothetical protein
VSLAGYTFIGGNLGVNSCAGIPAIFPNIPGTNFIYGTNGIVLNSEVYTTDILPYWDGNSFVLDDLTVSGRPAVPGLHGPAFLNLNLVSTISGGQVNIIGLSTMSLTAPELSINGTLNMNNFPIISTSNIKFTQITGIPDKIGIQAAEGGVSTISVFQAYDPDSITSPPIIKPMRTSYLYLTNGTPSTAPPNYDNDVYLSAESDSRVYATQQTGLSTSTFTVAYLTDPKNQYDFYCSPDGVDVDIPRKGTGKLLNPYRSINFALLQAAAIPDTSIVVIHLAAGTYTENVLVTRNNTFIVGNQIKHDINIGIDIIGTVTFNITGATAAVISGGISFCNMYQLNVVQSQALTGTYTVANCNMNPNTAIRAFTITGTALAVVHTVNLTNCDLNQNTASGCATIALGTAVFQNCDFRCSSASTIIEVTSIGRLLLQYCNLTSTFTGTAFNPLVNIANTSTTTGGQINYCTLQYTNKAIDAGLNKCCVRFANGAAVTYQITYCNLLCEGAQRANTGGAGTRFQCIQQTAGGTTNLFYGNLQGEGLAHWISDSASMNKTEYIAVP